MNLIFSHFGCIVNYSKEQSLNCLNHLKKYIATYMPLSKFTVIESKLDTFENLIIGAIPDTVDCMIILGGDGTVVNASKEIVKQKEIPILGIHIGTLGYLLDINENNLEKAIKQLSLGNYQIDTRNMLECYIESDINKIHDIAINDVVIGREGFSRVISVDLFINHEFVSNYKGDGILISTPTGSTGYNLSLSGPILAPQIPVFVITPIAVHSLAGNKSIVISENDIVSIKINETKKTQEKEALVSCDGRTYSEISKNTFIHIKKSKLKTSFIRFLNYQFWNNLTQKL